jgi:hypothetical protein
VLQPALQRMVAEATHAKDVIPDEIIQSLWSGYGEIIRLKLSGSDIHSVILKHVKSSITLAAGIVMPLMPES